MLQQRGNRLRPPLALLFAACIALAAARPSLALDARYTDADGDLVADVTSGRQKLDSVKDDDLPDNLRTLKPEQRQAA